MRRLTVLELALLALVLERPRSGHALRAAFAETPIGRYSSSPGAIYPALHRLTRAGRLRGVRDRTHPRRPATVYHLTSAGRRDVTEWLLGPVSTNEVQREPENLILRFAFLSLVGTRDDAVRFLEAFRDAMDGEVSSVDAWLRGPGADYPLLARLTLQHGVAVAGASADWARRSLAVLARAGDNPL